MKYEKKKKITENKTAFAIGQKQRNVSGGGVELSFATCVR